MPSSPPRNLAFTADYSDYAKDSGCEASIEI